MEVPKQERPLSPSSVHARASESKPPSSRSTGDLIIRILAGVLAVAAIGLLAAYLLVFKKPEPVFRGESASHWVDRLKDKDPKSRCEAVEALGAIGSESEQTLPALKLSLMDEEESVALAAGKAVAKMGWRAVGPSLQGMLADSDRHARARALVAIALLEPIPAESYGAFCETLAADEGDKDVGLVGVALVSAGRRSVSLLIRALDKTQHSSTRIRAARILAEIGSDAVDALPALRIASEDSDASLMVFAGEAITRIEGR